MTVFIVRFYDEEFYSLSFHPRTCQTHANPVTTAMYATKIPRAFISGVYRVWTVMLTRPVSTLATRNTASPFLFTASSSGGQVKGGNSTVAAGRWVLEPEVDRLALA